MKTKKNLTVFAWASFSYTQFHVACEPRTGHLPVQRISPSLCMPTALHSEKTPSHDNIICNISVIFITPNKQWEAKFSEPLVYARVYF